jgi:hypothetical protein
VPIQRRPSHPDRGGDLGDRAACLDRDALDEVLSAERDAAVEDVCVLIVIEAARSYSLTLLFVKEPITSEPDLVEVGYASPTTYSPCAPTSGTTTSTTAS